MCIRDRPYSTRHAPRATRGLVEPSWHVLSPGCRAVCIQTSRRRGRRVVRRVEEFDLSQAVGVGWLTAAAGIAIRSASCQQPRVAALVGQQQRLAFSPSLDGVTAHPTCAAPAAPAVSLLLSRTSLAARGLCAAPGRTRAHANNARTWLRRLVAALLGSGSVGSKADGGGAACQGAAAGGG